MQQLTEAVKDFAESRGDPVVLEQAAVVWAEYCLRTLRGELLRRGLEISRTIMDFLSEMQDGK